MSAKNGSHAKDHRQPKIDTSDKMRNLAIDESFKLRPRSLHSRPYIHFPIQGVYLKNHGTFTPMGRASWCLILGGIPCDRRSE